jgi:hypothetical protein
MRPVHASCYRIPGDDTPPSAYDRQDLLQRVDDELEWRLSTYEAAYVHKYSDARLSWPDFARVLEPKASLVSATMRQYEPCPFICKWGTQR